MSNRIGTGIVYLGCFALGGLSMIVGLTAVAFDAPDTWQLADRREALPRCEYVTGCDHVNATAEVERIEDALARQDRANLRAIGTGGLGALAAVGLSLTWRMYAGPLLPREDDQ